MRAVKVRVTGRVQGVFYRGWTQEEAEALGLTGWVRNERDGSVTALLVGPDAQVDAMLAALRRGPPAARVADVTVAAAEAEPTAGFEIRR
jgi:acylphosphatase